MIDVVKTRYFAKLPEAIADSIEAIEKNDSHVTAVEIHGPHSGFEIEYVEAPPLPPNHWKRTEIEK